MYSVEHNKRCCVWLNTYIVCYFILVLQHNGMFSTKIGYSNATTRLEVRFQSDSMHLQTSICISILISYI